ncbi:uncharacterized protein LOC141657078 [Silene latifolia]|uniref:uncharacterized protein LOC141657078 n=1 Tax=Silene latifolia TaxID=37657 RepID=UPI003D78557C
MVRPLQLTNEDVESELKFWSSAVYCYVLGANPPFKVIDGFIKRVWGYTDFDKISFNSNGTFLVRFKTEEMKLRVLQAGPIFFDNNPLIVKEWTPESKMVKEAVDVVPIWIRFYGLPLKFWGNALMKIAGLVGKPVRCDSNTLLKTFLGHARIMVEVKIGTELLDVIQFADELDNNHRQIVHYEWKPILCTDCQGLGHIARDCRKAKNTKGSRPVHQVWRPKKVPQNVTVPPGEHVEVAPEQPEQPIVQTRGPMGLESLGGMVTPMPGMVTPMPTIRRSFTPARIITKMTRHGESLQGKWRVVLLKRNMGSIGFWNVRGINSVNKQKEVSYFLHNNNIGVFGLLETRVRVNAINKVHQGIGSNWSLVHNTSVHDGGRIWIIWDFGNYTFDIISIEAQVIYVKITCINGQAWWMSVIYGFNKVHERIPLWDYLRNMRQAVNGPWLVMGDFNNVLAMCERVGSEVSNYELRGFQECVDDCGLVDLPAHGAYFTWNNKHEPGAMVFSRIDRAMSNDE